MGVIHPPLPFTIEGTVPPSCIYHSQKKMRTYQPNETLPDANSGDVFQDRCYKYSLVLHQGTTLMWNPQVINKRRKRYEPILHTINGYPVGCLTGTFDSCRYMVESPVLPPYTVTMHNTFRRCNSLRLAPKIPHGVENMCTAFWECHSLKVMPQIPDTVTDMDGTFWGCIQLENVCDIPASVIKVSRLFSSCWHLTVAPRFLGKPKCFFRTFHCCKNLIYIPGIPSGAESLEEAFAECTSLVTAPLIPEGIANLKRTFVLCESLQKRIEFDGPPAKNCYAREMLSGVNNPITLCCHYTDGLENVAADSGGCDVSVQCTWV